MELHLCPSKSSGSTNQVGNTVRSANGMDIVCFFSHVVSETARDIAESYAHKCVGTIPEHPFEGSTISELLGLENCNIWGTNECNKFLTLLEEKPFWTILEVFCDNFIHMAQISDPEQLLHLSRALLYGIHSVFIPPNVSGHNRQDPISNKKLDSGEGQWAVIKEVLGWMVDGATRCIKLARDKKSVIDAELHKIVRMTKGVPFKQIEKLIGKILHAAIAVPMGKHIMTPINKILQVKLQKHRSKDFPAAKQAF